MRGRGIVLAVLTVAAAAAEPKLEPRRDPPGQLFRRAPMAESARSIVVNLSSNLHYAFDPEFARVHTVWLGESLSLRGPPYSQAKAPFICDFKGKVLFSFPQISPWMANDESLPIRFRAIDTLSNEVAFSYDLITGTTNIAVLEKWETKNDSLSRTFSFPKGCSRPVSYVAFAENGATAETFPTGVSVRGTNGPISIEAKGFPISARTSRVRYVTTRITEEATEKGFKKQPFDGPELRVHLEIPARNEPFSFSLSYGVNAPLSPPNLGPSTARIFQGSDERRASSGDDSYRIEYFPLPREAELLITGLAWLTENDLMVCTWLGDLFLVKHASGEPGKATYHRFAQGLNEPLGVAVHRGAIYVVQKGELTKLSDTDADGVADRFECINSSWGYSGNYHSYSFGPLIDAAHNFYVFVTGQRGLYELPFQGWSLKVSANGEQISPFCSGLRVPHGWGFYGAEKDIFVTDNQGNWVGACRLNHLQEGRFYGFPSSTPAPKETPRAADVEPPVLWFPRSLAPSASGFTTIDDDRFGPFKGQLLIGDFQNSIVMRAYLEKVHGRWQGAVFPFAKGFLSGVNRLTMGADAKLYVGGGKRTWSTAAPKEFSLDRVSFTGEVPFEVLAARATRDGFELTFTKPIDRESGSDAANYLIKQFAYRYHQEYGSPEFDHDGRIGATETPIREVQLEPDGRTVRLRIPSLRAGFVTSFRLALSSAEDEELRGDTFYYTLNRQPDGQ